MKTLFNVLLAVAVIPCCLVPVPMPVAIRCVVAGIQFLAFLGMLALVFIEARK